MKIEIDDQQLLIIRRLIGLKLLTHASDINIIESYETVSETITPKNSFFNKNPEPIEKIYLTEFELMGYNPDLKFVGTYKDEYIMYFVQHDLIRMRKRWVKFETQLNAINEKLEANKLEKNKEEE